MAKKSEMADEVALKPEAVDVKKTAVDENVSDLPYHTKETQEIAEKRAKKQEGTEPAPYEYKVNGYTVTEIEGANLLATDPADANKLWQVTADDFEKVFNVKRDAEVFAETHALAFKDQPATMPSA